MTKLIIALATTTFAVLASGNVAGKKAYAPAAAPSIGPNIQTETAPAGSIVSKRTVDFHIDNARNKPGVSSRTEAAVNAKARLAHVARTEIWVRDVQPS